MKKVITHTNATFNKIPSGIFNKISKISSSTKNNAQMIRHMTSKVGLKNRRQIIFTAHVQTLEAKCKPVKK